MGSAASSGLSSLLLMLYRKATDTRVHLAYLSLLCYNSIFDCEGEVDQP